MSSFFRTVIITLGGTFPNPCTGLVATTIGGVTSGPGPTTNCVAVAGAALAARSVTPETDTVTTWRSGSGVCGVRYTSRFWLANAIEYSIARSALATPIVAPVTVSGLIGSLKRTTITALSPTLIAPCGGVTDRTAGATP